eukprot:SAG25_NODE_1619_length_2662_cov_2.448693_1_plen_544_part_00
MRSDMLDGRRTQQQQPGAGGRRATKGAPVGEVASLVRSPSWPPMTVDVSDELTRVARPKSIRKALVVATICFLNNVAIFTLSCYTLREYLQIDTAEPFGPGLTVSGHLTADSFEVTVPEPQNAVFRSQSANSALSIRAATSHAAELVLGKGLSGSGGTKGPSDWVLTNNPADQFVLSQAGTHYLNIDGASTTSTISTHVDIEANTMYGAPLVLSTGAPVPGQETQCASHSDCGAGQCLNSGFCGPGVVAADILLAPGSSGSVRFNGPIEPLYGDLVLVPEERIIVRKQAGTVGTGAAQLLLENTHLLLLSPGGASCVSACKKGACPVGISSSFLCPGMNTLRTLTATEALASHGYGRDGSLSVSDVLYVHPSTTAHPQPEISVAGSIDVDRHQIVGAPLYLTARNGTNVTLEAMNNGHIVLNSPLKMTGPIIPTQMSGSVPMVHVQGTVKVQNLQFELQDSDKDRADGDAKPGMICAVCNPPPVCTSPTNCAIHSSCATTPKCCSYDDHQRHGWVRLTQDQAGRRYHLYFCTQQGWQEISPTD